MTNRTAIATGLIALLVLGGCQGSRLNSLNSGGSTVAEPLQAAPSGTVTASQLPPPTAPTPSQFPVAPTAPNTQVAAVDPTAQAAAEAAAPDITKSSVVGSWGVTSAGSSCQMFLTLTKYGNGSRGGTRGCSGTLSDMRGWDVSGKQLVLYDANGGTLGRLYSSGGEKFDGQTASGQAVSLTR